MKLEEIPRHFYRKRYVAWLEKELGRELTEEEKKRALSMYRRGFATSDTKRSLLGERK